MRKSVVAVLSVVILALIGWFLFGLGEPAELASRLHRPGSVAASGETKLAALAAESGARGLGEHEGRGGDPAPAVPASEMHRFEFTVQLQDSEGRPYSGVGVQVAPPDHPFVTLATTDSDGFAAVNFGAVEDSLSIDLAFVDANYDLTGFHRLRLFSDKARIVRVDVPRRFKIRRAAEMRSRMLRAKGREMVEDRLQLRGNERENGNTRRGIRWRPDRYAASARSGLNIFGVAKLESGSDSSSKSYQGQLDAIMEEIQNEQTVLKMLLEEEGVGTIRGQILDGAGEPLYMYPVWAEFSGPRDVEEQTVFTGQDGSFILKVLPGEVRCYVGQGDGVLTEDFRIAEGETLQWNPIVSLAATVRLSLPSEIGDEFVNYEVQANVDDGRVLTITRRRFHGHGSMLFPVHNSLPTSLHLLYIDGQSAYPIHHIGFFSAGDWMVLDSVDCVPDLSTATAPSFSVSGVRPTFFPEVLVLLPDEDWGYRAGLKPMDHELAWCLIPSGHWRVDMSLGAMGRQSLGAVFVESNSTVALPSFAIPEPGVLKLNSASDGPRSVTVTQLRRDIITRAFESEHVFQAGHELRVLVRAGEYRVEVAGENGPQFDGVVTVLGGQTTSLDV